MNLVNKQINQYSAWTIHKYTNANPVDNHYLFSKEIVIINYGVQCNIVKTSFILEMITYNHRRIVNLLFIYYTNFYKADCAELNLPGIRGMCNSFTVQSIINRQRLQNPPKNGYNDITIHSHNYS